MPEATDTTANTTASKPRRALKRGKYFMAECHIDDKPPGSSGMERSILGDPGADSGGEESLNRRENMAQKKSKERPEEPLGTMSYQTSSKRSPPF